MKNKDSYYKLTDTLLFYLEHAARLSRISAMHYFEENPDISISYNDFSIIDSIYLNPEIHQRDLSKLLGKDTANLSRDLDRLEKQGFIVRSVDTKGKRIVKKIVLSEQGHNLRNNIACIASSHVQQIESVFTNKEKLQFKEYIQRLEDSLK